MIFTSLEQITALLYYTCFVDWQTDQSSHQRLLLHSHYRSFIARASALTTIKVSYTACFPYQQVIACATARCSLLSTFQYDAIYCTQVLPLSLLISIACNNAPTFTSTQLLFGNQRQTVGIRFSTHSNFRLFKSSVRPHFRGYSPYTASLHNHRQPTPL